jgi:hypothetical protein
MKLKLIITTIALFIASFAGAQNCEWCVNVANPKTLTLSCNSPNAPITYSWTGPGGFSSTQAQISPTVNGNYVGTCTDADGCTFSESWAVSILPLNTITPTTTNATCGLSNGSAFISIQGNTSISWSNGQTGQNLLNVAAGAYIATVTQNNGCVQQVSVTINENGGPQLASIPDISFCDPHQPNAAVQVTLSTLTTGPFTFTLTQVSNNNQEDIVTATNGNATLTFEQPIESGLYQVRVVDANGCSSTRNFNVTVGALSGSVICN